MKNHRSKLSREQEIETMKNLGGVRHKASGATPTKRQDGHTKEELVECKRTDNKRSITIKLSDLDQNIYHAMLEGKIPIFEIQMGKRSFYILCPEDYWELRERAFNCQEDRK